MYSPGNQHFDSEQAMLSFIQQHPFAIIINSQLQMGLLPLALSADNQYLCGHAVTPNPLLKTAEDETVKAVFLGPHGYIPPSFYGAKQNLPTWNYVAVEAVADYQPVSSDNRAEAIQQAVQALDPDYHAQMEHLPTKWVNSKLSAIGAFQLKVRQLQGRIKLGQNKSAEELQQLTLSLQRSVSLEHQQLYRLMVHLGYAEPK